MVAGKRSAAVERTGGGSGRAAGDALAEYGTGISLRRSGALLGRSAELDDSGGAGAEAGAAGTEALLKAAAFLDQIATASSLSRRPSSPKTSSRNSICSVSGLYVALPVRS
jgi:hypothetical protein